MIINGYYRRFRLAHFLTLFGFLVISYLVLVSLMQTINTNISHTMVTEELTTTKDPIVEMLSNKSKSIETEQLKTNNKLTKVLSILSNLKEEIQNLKMTVSHFSKWDRFVDYRRKLVNIGKFNLTAAGSHPHIVIDDVSVDCRIHHKLIILVSSHSPNFERRKIIRTVWGNHTMWITKEKFKVIFVLGGTTDKAILEKVRKESSRHKDIIMEDIAESFYKLSYKVIIGLEWTLLSAKFDFILKCDDDIFVQIDRLINRINGPFKDQHYIGHVMYGQPVARKGRYAVSNSMFPKTHFDPYCSGGGFLISRHAAQSIIPLFNWAEPLVIDDAYIGNLIFKAGIKEHHVPDGFYMWNDWCEYNERLLISHPAKLEKCIEFLQKRSMHDNGLAVHKSLVHQRYGFPEYVKTKPPVPATTAKSTQRVVKSSVSAEITPTTKTITEPKPD